MILQWYTHQQPSFFLLYSRYIQTNNLIYKACTSDRYENIVLCCIYIPFRVQSNVGKYARPTICQAMYISLTFHSFLLSSLI